MPAQQKKVGFFSLGKKPKKINLLPQEEFTESTWGRVLTWLMSSFRVIVIATEMVVMGAFLSRFWLDAIASDLNDEIKQKSAVIESYSSIEVPFRAAQKKLDIFSAMTVEGAALPLIQTITTALPEGAALTSIKTDPSEITIQARAFSESEIAQLVTNLDSTEQFETITLEAVTADATSPEINFSLKLVLKE